MGGRVPTLWILDQVQNDDARHHVPALWIPASAGNDAGGRHCGLDPQSRGVVDALLIHPLLPVSSTGTGPDSSPIKGEGMMPVHHWVVSRFRGE